MKSRISLFLLSIYITGCFTVYKPNAVQSPMLFEKGDLVLSGSMGVIGTGLLNLQSAYAIDDHTGIMANAMMHSRVETRDSLKELLNIYSTEMAVGYFDKLETDDRVQFHCYVGGGLGKSLVALEGGVSLNPTITSQYYNCFVQPGVTFFSKGIKTGIDLKANYVRLKYFNSNIFDQYKWWPNELMGKDTSLSFLNLEPAVTFRFGKKRVKGITQLGLTIPTLNSGNYFSVNTQSLFFITLVKFSAGIGYSINVESNKRNVLSSKNPLLY